MSLTLYPRSLNPFYIGIYYNKKGPRILGNTVYVCIIIRTLRTYDINFVKQVLNNWTWNRGEIQ